MIDFKLTEDEIETIQWAMKHSPKAEVRQRATAVHMLHQGQRVEKVAEMMAVSTVTIYEWHKRWRAGGLEGLANQPKSGRPRQATEAYCQMLEEVIDTDPSRYGYAFGIWTVDRLRAHLEHETGIRLSNRRFRDLLKAEGYVYRRPKHDVTSLQDADEVERGKVLLDWLKKDASPTALNSSLWTKQP